MILVVSSVEMSSVVWRSGGVSCELEQGRDLRLREVRYLRGVEAVGGVWALVVHVWSERCRRRCGRGARRRRRRW